MNMNYLSKGKAYLRLCAVVGGYVVGSTLAFAAENASLESIVNEVTSIQVKQQRAEASVSSSVEQRQDAIAEYVRLERELENRLLYNTEKNLQIRNQKATILVLKDSLNKVDQVSDSIPPLLSKMVTSLQTFVADHDLPFSQDVRLANIETVRNDLLREIPISQKVSTVLDLYGSELAYGKTINAYSDEVDVDGSVREVNILRWGRVAMLYQTADKSVSAIYNKDSGSWDTLALEHRNEINKAVRMAQKLASLDLVLLPIQAPVDVTIALNQE